MTVPTAISGVKLVKNGLGILKDAVIGIDAIDAADVAASTADAIDTAADLTADTAGDIIEGAADVIYSPINPGPLSQEVANSFRSATYTEKVLTEDTVFYRVYGGSAKQMGSYMSRTEQLGGMQSQFDLALDPDWGNTATYVTPVTVPKGTVIYEGTAAPQGAFLGGGDQVFIPKEALNPSWFH